jgi:hypothetical protein
MVTVAATLPAVGLTAFAATSADASTPQQVGSAPVLPRGAAKTGAPSGSQRLDLDVELAPRNQAALDAFVQGVSDPHSVAYKHYLAKGQFASTFGPTQATIDAVTGELRAEGLQPGHVSPDGLTIPVTTTVAQAGSVLGTSFANYKVAGGRIAYSNTTAPHLPASVAGAVTGITGLNNLVDPKPMISNPHPLGYAPPIPARAQQPQAAVRPHIQGPSMCGNVRSWLNNNLGLTETQNYWEPGSLDQPGAYNTVDLYGNYGNTGQGVTVGLFELENYAASDFTNYSNCFGGGPDGGITTTRVDNGPTGFDVNNLDGLETALDFDMVAGMAPGVSVQIYQGPNAGPNGPGTPETTATILDTYRRMVTDDTAQVLSTSWGECEVDTDPNLISGLKTVFSEAAAQGQSVIAAAGDSGSTDCFPDANNSNNNTVLNVDIPGGLANVTSAGGLEQQGLNAGNPGSTLSVWDEPDTSQAPAGAGGGGVSLTQVMPTTGNYQSGVTGVGYTNACSAPTGSTCRQVPDISGLADGNTGYVTLYSSGPQGGPGVWLPSGTSGAAPLMAAITALADGSAACAANGNAGFLNPALYQNPSAMVDVTVGSNDFGNSGYTGGLYQASTGYDLASGLGMPVAPQVVEAVCDTPAGSAGGSFVPLSPRRVLDTRSATGVPGTTPIGPNGTVRLQVDGVAGVPSSNVTAVVLNVTAVSPTTASFLTVFPDGAARPTASELNFTPGETIPNLVTVPVINGVVDFYNHVGSTHVAADLEGYYTTASGSLYQPLTPVRVLDTRNTGGPIGPGGVVKLPIEGSAGVPGSGVTSVVLNVTATAPTQNSYLTVYPDGQGVPFASNLNFSPGETIPNLVTVQVGADGAVDLFNHVGTVQAVADLEGYYTGSGSGLKFHSSVPHRLLDTRDQQGVAAGELTPIAQGATLHLPLDDRHGLGNKGPLATAGGLVLNVTVTNPSGNSFLTVFPDGSPLPGVSNLNFTPGETIPNAVITPGAGQVDFFNHIGNTDVVADLLGYFSTS